MYDTKNLNLIDFRFITVMKANLNNNKMQRIQVKRLSKNDGNIEEIDAPISIYKYYGWNNYRKGQKTAMIYDEIFINLDETVVNEKEIVLRTPEFTTLIKSDDGFTRGKLIKTIMGEYRKRYKSNIEANMYIENISYDANNKLVDISIVKV
jgi:hypothetical protein